MSEVLERNALERWRQNPVSFIEEVLRDPETGQPFQLFDAQRQFFEHAWKLTEDGRALYTEQCFAAPKKSAKTGTAALHVLTSTCLYGGRFAEAYCAANDFEQAASRVFQQIKRIVEASPYLRHEAEILANRITFPSTGATIQAISGDAAGSAGAHPVISSFDELWGFVSERSRRMWDEMVQVPTKKFSVRLTTTYAGFSGESELLEEMYKRGLQQPEIAPNLYAGDGLLMFWSHEPIAPWQDERWLTEMRRSLRPNQFLRMIENRFVASEQSFIEMSAFDRCVQPTVPLQQNRSLPVYIGVDASIKHDSTAIVVVSWDSSSQCVRLIQHRTFQPSPEEPLDFEQTIELTLMDLNRRFSIRQILYDPYQMMASAQRLTKAGLPLQEFPQSSPNLTAASQNLYELISNGSITLYPTVDLRLAMSRAVAIETPRGWRIGKDKQTHKIDVVVALAMAAYACVKGAGESTYDLEVFSPNYQYPDSDPAKDRAREYNRALAGQIYAASNFTFWPG